MNVFLATPEKVVYGDDADEVCLVAEKGQITILPRHANLLTLVKPGEVVIKSSSGEKRFRSSEGVAKVEGDRLSILCRDVQAA